MAAIQPVRGTHDLLGDDLRRHRHVVDTARRVAETYGYAEWQTPIFEHTEVFSRAIGETTDVVSKEMYSFPDRGGESLTLRPEGTAGICRALLTNGLAQSLPQRAFYAGPVFRYERPQKGRYRQFHQIGVELLGPAEPLADAETIACGWDILAGLGIGPRVTVEVNTLGDAASRADWRTALVDYFRAHADALSPESRDRLERNPLRIVDSKDERDRALLCDAPTIAPFLNDASRAHWDSTRRHLDALGVPFTVNPNIVRGLDYYSHTAFEFTTTELGAQGTVLAGGRYDGLVAALGGPAVPAIGWAAGIERLALLLEAAPAAPTPVAVIPLGDDTEPAALAVLQSLRRAGLAAEMSYRGNAKRRFERARGIDARAVVVIGSEELGRGVASVRVGGTQNDVPFGLVAEHLM